MSAAQWHENNNEACRSDATPAQVTEAHYHLALRINRDDYDFAWLDAQLIADSEARAVELLADRNYEVCAERDQLRTECNNLRAKSCQCAYDEACAHVLRAERAEDELLAVKMELDQVACARTDGILNESDLQCALNMEREKVKRLTTALKDAISTYDPDRKETLVTAERQEAWISALKGGAK